MRMGMLAVRGVEKAELLSRLGEIESDDPPRLFDDPCVGVTPDGWVIVHKPTPEFPTDQQLALASELGETVGYSGCTVVMWTAARGYREGREIWSVEHNCEWEDEPLRVAGLPPPAFEAIEAAARKSQGEEEDERVNHFFDVTGVVVASVCGFNPEDGIELEYTKLRPLKSPRRPGLLDRLFGRR